MVHGSDEMGSLPGPVRHAAGHGPAHAQALGSGRKPEDLVIRAELPGIDPEKDVEITLRDGLLTIRGERRHEERTSENGISRFESASGSFERSVVLPQGVKEDDITAG